MGDDANARCHGLIEQTQQSGPRESPNDIVASLRASLEARSEVSGVEVGNTHKEAGTYESQKLATREGERSQRLVELVLVSRGLLDVFELGSGGVTC